MLYENRIEDFAAAFVKTFLYHLAPEGNAILDFKTDLFNRFIVMIKSSYGIRYRLCFALRKDYLFYEKIHKNTPWGYSCYPKHLFRNDQTRKTKNPFNETTKTL